MKTKTSISLTGVLVEDTEAKGYTAWFAEFPEAVAEGETEQEVKMNLFQSLIAILEVRKDEEMSEEITNGHRFKKTSFNLELAY